MSLNAKKLFYLNCLPQDDVTFSLEAPLPPSGYKGRQRQAEVENCPVVKVWWNLSDWKQYFIRGNTALTPELAVRATCDSAGMWGRGVGGRLRSQLHPSSRAFLCQAVRSAAVLQSSPKCPGTDHVILETGNVWCVLGHNEMSLEDIWGVLSPKSAWVSAEFCWTAASHCLVLENGKKLPEWQKIGENEKNGRKLALSRDILH